MDCNLTPAATPVKHESTSFLRWRPGVAGTLHGSPSDHRLPAPATDQGPTTYQESACGLSSARHESPCITGAPSERDFSPRGARSIVTICPLRHRRPESSACRGEFSRTKGFVEERTKNVSLKSGTGRARLLPSLFAGAKSAQRELRPPKLNRLKQFEDTD
jgi:hypothetical protein